MKYKLGDCIPQCHQDTFVAPNASIIGNVTIGKGSSVWFNAVVRADNDSVTIGDNTNLQEGAVLHCDPGFPLTIGQGVTVGHQATVHGCTVGDFSLIGINAVVLNGAKIGKHCLIGANALIPENTEIPDGSLVVGSPAKVLKPLNDTQKLAFQCIILSGFLQGQLFSQQLAKIDS